MESNNDQNKMWNNLKKMAKIQKKVDGYEEIRFEGVPCSDAENIRNKFSEYFVSCIQKDIDDVNYQCTSDKNRNIYI